MLSRVGELIAEIKNNPPPLPVEEIAEATQFLEWLVANNFTFLGVREYALTGDERGYEVVPEQRARHPALAGRARAAPRQRAGLDHARDHGIPEGAEAAHHHQGERALARAPARAHGLHRGEALRPTTATLIGEFRIVGLFTSTAYTRSTRSIPYLRRKVDNLMRRSGFDPDSHSGKAFAAVLEHYSRDELFQIDEDTLFQFVLAIMHLDERPRVRVLARRDRFDRFVSVMVFVPRERYDSAARVAIGTYLAGAYKGRVSAFYPVLHRKARWCACISSSRASAARRRTRIARRWSARSRRWCAPGPTGSPKRSRWCTSRSRRSSSIRRYRDAFPIAYREAYVPPAAVADIRLIESLSPIRPLGADFYSRREGDHAGAGLKVWSREKPIALSERVPVLENMGFKVVDERTYRIEPGEAGAARCGSTT